MALFLALSLVQLVNSLVLHVRSGDYYYLSPFLPEGPREFEVSAEVVEIEDLWDTKWTGGNPYFVGKIAALYGEDKLGMWREDYVYQAQSLGFIGLVGWTTWVPDHFGEIKLSTEPLLIPFVSVSLDDFGKMRELIAGNNGSTVTLVSTDSPNPWMAVFQSTPYILFAQCLYSIGFIMLSLLSIHRLWRWAMFYRNAKSVSKIAVISLVLELICNVIRATFWAAGGALACRSIPFAPMRVMYTCTAPLNFLVTSLTAVYIHEVLTTKSLIGTMVERTRKPLSFLSAFYLLTDWPLSVISAFKLSAWSADMATLSAGLLTAGQGLTAALLLYITLKLRSYLGTRSPKNSDRDSTGPTSPRASSPRGSSEFKPPDRLKMLLDRVRNSTYWLLFTTAALVFTLFPTFHGPVGFVCTNAAIFFGFGMVSFLHILAYGRTPSLKKTQSKPLFNKAASGNQSAQSAQRRTGGSKKQMITSPRSAGEFVELADMEAGESGQPGHDDTKDEKREHSRTKTPKPEGFENLSVLVSPEQGTAITTPRPVTPAVGNDDLGGIEVLSPLGEKRSASKEGDPRGSKADKESRDRLSEDERPSRERIGTRASSPKSGQRPSANVLSLSPRVLSPSPRSTKSKSTPSETKERLSSKDSNKKENSRSVLSRSSKVHPAQDEESGPGEQLSPQEPAMSPLDTPAAPIPEEEEKEPPT